MIDVTRAGSTGRSPLDPTAVPVARIIYGGFAAIYGLLCLLYLIAPPLEPHLVFAGILAAGALLFSGLAVALPRASAGWLEAGVLGSVLLAQAGALAFVPLTGDPKQSVVVVMVIVAAGTVLPTARTTVLAAAAGVAGWLLVARHFPTPDLVHWLVNVCGAAAVSIAVGLTRLHALRDLALTRIMMEHASDAIALLDRDGRFVYANDATCKMLGFSRAELLRRSPKGILPALAAAEWPTTWATMQRERTLVVQSTHLTRDGVEVPIEASLDLVSLGGRDYVCTVNRDVRERRLVEERLERARHAAEAASRAKSEFLATMSHEMRTPLNGVFGMLDLALEAKTDDERRDLLLDARASAENLLGVLAQVLDHAELETGRMRVHAVDFDLRELGRLVVSGLAGEARRRKVDLQLHLDAALPERIHGDPRILRQILGQILANALKFTDEGEVELRLENARGASGSAEVVASVRDTGIGIAAENLATIFEPFTQIDSSNARRHGGVGLGLALVRDLVHAMDGTIEVASTPGVGSCFTCHLPSTPVLAVHEARGAEL